MQFARTRVTSSTTGTIRRAVPTVDNTVRRENNDDDEDNSRPRVLVVLWRLLLLLRWRLLLLVWAPVRVVLRPTVRCTVVKDDTTERSSRIRTTTAEGRRVDDDDVLMVPVDKLLLPKKIYILA